MPGEIITVTPAKQWTHAGHPYLSGRVRRHAIKFESLDVDSLREIVRLIRDFEHEKQAAVNRARRMPWRM
jgi:hypothetical protein